MNAASSSFLHVTPANPGQTYQPTTSPASLSSSPAVLPPAVGPYFPPYGQTKEKKRIADRLGAFNPKDNLVWKAISTKFGSSIKFPELLSIANVLAVSAAVHLDRDAKRRKCVLIKWFEEHWPVLAPYFDTVVLQTVET
jgi:hypothetical protein